METAIVSVIFTLGLPLVLLQGRRTACRLTRPRRISLTAPVGAS